MARNLSDAEDGFLRGKRYLIHDRDPLFTVEFMETLGTIGVQLVKLPPRSPNLNAHAERFVRTIKESCLERMILFGEASLRNAIREFVEPCRIILAGNDEAQDIRRVAQHLTPQAPTPPLGFRNS